MSSLSDFFLDWGADTSQLNYILLKKLCLSLGSFQNQCFMGGGGLELPITQYCWHSITVYFIFTIILWNTFRYPYLPSFSFKGVSSKICFYPVTFLKQYFKRYYQFIFFSLLLSPLLYLSCKILILLLVGSAYPYWKRY